MEGRPGQIKEEAAGQCRNRARLILGSPDKESDTAVGVQGPQHTTQLGL